MKMMEQFGEGGSLGFGVCVLLAAGPSADKVESKDRAMVFGAVLQVPGELSLGAGVFGAQPLDLPQSSPPPLRCPLPQSLPACLVVSEGPMAAPAPLLRLACIV